MLITFFCRNCDAKLEIKAEAAGTRVDCPKCKTPLVVPEKGLGPDTTLGGFRIKAQIGEGGMGQVYLARQISMDRDVALKVLSPALTVDKAEVDRFLNEVRLAARLDHPHIVTAYEAGEDNGLYYLAMAYVKGESLWQRIERLGPLEESKALDIVLNVASALAYAWNKHQMLHRDVKPDNILLDEDERPRLTDMGLSKVLGIAGRRTAAGIVMGTPNYMSPEQAEGRTPIDCRADMYALGASLYHMLTGKAPFDGKGMMDILRAHAAEKLPSPRGINPKVSRPCEELMARMLARKPEHRHDNWEALISDIKRVRKGHMPSHRSPSVRETVLKRRQSAGGAAHGQRRIQVLHGDMQKRRDGPAATTASAPGAGLRTLTVVLLALLFATFVATLYIHAERRRQARLEHQARQQHLLALKRQWYRIVRYRHEHPKDFAGILKKLEDLRQRAPGTTVAADAEAALRKVKQERHQAEALARKADIDNSFDNVRDHADRLWKDGRRQEAIVFLRQYTGPHARETAARRRDLANEWQQKWSALQEAEARAKASRQKAAEQKRLKDLTNQLAGDLFAGDFTRAAGRLERAEREHAFEQARQEWQAVRTLVHGVLQVHDNLVASFAEDQGRSVEVELRSGPEKLLINGVENHTVLAERRIRRESGAVVSTPRPFTIADLTARERFRRLGKAETPDRDLMRGLLACEASAFSKAREFFQRVSHPLSSNLLSRVDAARAGAAEH